MRFNFCDSLKATICCGLVMLAGLSAGAVAPGYLELKALAKTFAPPDSAAYWNARANFALARASVSEAGVDTAIQFYHRAISFALDDPGLKLNLAIAYLMINDTLSADSLFWLAYEQTGNSLAQMHELLGLEYEDQDATKAKARNVTEEEVKTRMVTSVNDGKKRNQKPAGSNKPIHKKPAGKQKDFRPEEIRLILYWREVKE